MVKASGSASVDSSALGVGERIAGDAGVGGVADVLAVTEVVGGTTPDATAGVTETAPVA
jgi:hypothetical protein